MFIPLYALKLLIEHMRDLFFESLKEGNNKNAWYLLGSPSVCRVVGGWLVISLTVQQLRETDAVSITNLALRKLRFGEVE